ncbi:MAG: restriction endonuclease [Bacteroidales bacterium]|nr:restriction endonuclease [Bacteroidales bacterium]
MDNYDFNILQPTEFECLTRDLLQKKENIFIESFTDGRDNGIDLRFSLSKNQKTIVQAKRYKDFSKLKSILKKEADKVVRLSPDRYIIATSVGLTPNNKDEIVNLFSNKGVSVISTDILGRDELNNILSKHRDIEKKYYKLWLASSNVLETIIHKSIENYSEFELNTIRAEISNYVMNPSFNDAKKLLYDNHYVIISGIPGIGKTTLARMLVYNILAEGFDEFIYLDSIDSAMNKLQTGKKQVFFYDDFLGNTMLDIRESAFENKLIHFIREIERRRDSLFILTTREYILQDANLNFEKIKIENLSISKCIINIESYSDVIKAQILYNHLCSANIPNPCIIKLLEKKKYLNLIRHKNFNPRIVEAFLKQKKWICSPLEFYEDFIKAFDNPTFVWDYAFSKLQDVHKKALIVLATMGGSALLSEWKRATRYFCEKTNVNITDDLWGNCLKLLEDSFIKIHRNKWKGLFVIFHNPSIMDYMIGYIKNRPSIITDCIKYAVFVDQLYLIFKEKTNKNSLSQTFVPIYPEQFNLLHKTYKELLIFNEICQLHDLGKDVIRKESYSVSRTLQRIAYSQPTFLSKNNDIISSTITEDNLQDIVSEVGEDLVELINVVGIDKFKISPHKLSKVTLGEISLLPDCLSWCKLFEDEALSYCDAEKQFVVDNFNRIAEVSIRISSTSEELEEQLESIKDIVHIIPYIDANKSEAKIIDKLTEVEEKKEKEDSFEGYDVRDVDFFRTDPKNDFYDMYSSLLYN